MSIDAPREIRDSDGRPTGLWHYTRSQDGRMWPIGYCSAVRLCGEYPDCVGSQPPCDCGGVGLVRTLEACVGHPTAQDAATHYLLWCYDHARYDGRKGASRPCSTEDCRARTRAFAIAGGKEFPFCERHLNRESLAVVLGIHPADEEDISPAIVEVDDVGLDEEVGADE